MKPFIPFYLILATVAFIAAPLMIESTERKLNAMSQTIELRTETIETYGQF